MPGILSAMDNFERLAAIFNRKNPDGSFHYSDEDVRHWLPLIIIAGGFPADTWTAEMTSAMAQLAVNAKLDAEHDDEALKAKIDAYYTRYPVNPELARELEELVGAVSLDDHEAMTRRALAAFRSVRPGPAVRLNPGLTAPTSSGATGRGRRR
jgi:hypothetical protein